MATYAEFLKKQKEYNDRDDAAFDKIIASFNGIAGDVKALKDTIAKLQASAGQVTAEDQALIDSLESRANTVSPKIEALTKSLSDLDNETAPEAPSGGGGTTTPPTGGGTTTPPTEPTV